MKIIGMIIAILSTIGTFSVSGVITRMGVAFKHMLREFGQNSAGVNAYTGLLGYVFTGMLLVMIGGSFALIMFAGSETFNVQIAIEENTHRAVRYLQSPTPIAPTFSGFLQPVIRYQHAGVLAPPMQIDQDFSTAHNAS